MAQETKREWIKIGVDNSVDDLRRYGPSLPLQVSKIEDQQPRLDVHAQLDTGANHSCCSPGLGQLLGIPPSGSLFQHHAGREPQSVPVFRARLWFPGGTQIDADLAVLSSLAEPHAILIGRDILSMCRLDVDFLSGRTELHMKVPS